VVEIDYLARVIRLHDPSTFTYDGPGERLAIDLSMRVPIVAAALVANDGASWVDGTLRAPILRRTRLILNYANKEIIINPTSRTPKSGAAGVSLARLRSTSREP
jgi:hypothetical protein